MREVLRGWSSGTSLQTNEEGTDGQKKSKVQLHQGPMGSSGAEMTIQIILNGGKAIIPFSPPHKTEVSVDKVSPLVEGKPQNVIRWGETGHQYWPPTFPAAVTVGMFQFCGSGSTSQCPPHLIHVALGSACFTQKMCPIWDECLQDSSRSLLHGKHMRGALVG